MTRRLKRASPHPFGCTRFLDTLLLKALTNLKNSLYFLFLVNKPFLLSPYWSFLASIRWGHREQGPAMAEHSVPVHHFSPHSHRALTSEMSPDSENNLVSTDQILQSMWVLGRQDHQSEKRLFPLNQ
jgi:hypothetical protein